MATKVNLEELARELPYLRPRQKLWIVLKRGLKPIGHWKEMPRGVHSKKKKPPYKSIE